MLKKLSHGHVISDINGEKIDGTFYEKALRNTDKVEYRIEKILKRNGDKLKDDSIFS